MTAASAGAAAAGVPPAYLRLRDNARELLIGWAAPDAEQERLRRRYLTHLDAEPGGTWREGPAEHLTASVLVLDHTGEQVLLTLHKKARMWLQLGGHLEPQDASIVAAATREAHEESGMDDLAVAPTLVQLHQHDLAAAFGHCRSHLDVRFVAQAAQGAQPVVSQESLDVRWWPADALPEPTDPELPELIAAARAVLASVAATAAPAATAATAAPATPLPPR